MIRTPPRSTLTYTLFPTRRSSDLHFIGPIQVQELLGRYIRIVRMRQRHRQKERLFALQAPQVVDFLHTAMHDLVVVVDLRSEEHTSELQSLMRISYDAFCLKKK